MNLCRQSQNHVPTRTTAKSIGPNGPLMPVVSKELMTKTFALNILNVGQLKKWGIAEILEGGQQGQWTGDMEKGEPE